MATLARVRALWSGAGVVGPGVSTFYTNDSDGSVLAQAVLDLFDDVKGALPPTVNIDVGTSGETIDSFTGDLNGVWSGGPGAGITGTGAGAFAAGVGCRIVWNTAGIVGGRNVKGSTFLVPIGTSSYENDGTMTSGTVTAFQTAANTFLTTMAGAFVIWSRPSGLRTGQFSVVQSALVPDKVSWLRSRRT